MKSCYSFSCYYYHFISNDIFVNSIAIFTISNAVLQLAMLFLL